MPLAFASFDQTEVDALVEKNDRIFHVEFQIWNDETIRYRMLDYRNSLYKSYFMKKSRKPRSIIQKVLYVGFDPMKMGRAIEDENFAYSFSLADIREFEEDWRHRLKNSRLPLNWILAELCSNDSEEAVWHSLAERIAKHLSQNGCQCSLPLASILLVAATLRRVSKETRVGFIKMFRLNVGNDPILKQIYDGGVAFEKRDILTRAVVIGLEARNLDINAHREKILSEMDLDELEQVMMSMVAGHGADEIMTLFPEGTFATSNGIGGPELYLSKKY